MKEEKKIMTENKKLKTVNSYSEKNPEPNTLFIPEQYNSMIEDLRLLKTDSNNPNFMSADMHAQLWKSLSLFGWAFPIVTNKEGLIADGEQKVTVCLDHNVFFGPVLRLNVEDVDRRLLRQVLNKIKGRHEITADALEFVKIVEANKKKELKELLALTDENLECILSVIDAEDKSILEHYKQMPDYTQGTIEQRSISVHFRDNAAVDEFASLVKQKITAKTKYIHFPEREVEVTAHLRVKQVEP